MSQALEIAAVGMLAQQRALETIADNISNVNTPTYKRSDLRFADLVSASSASTKADAHQTTPTVMGVRFWADAATDAQGQIEQTGNPLDIAVDGKGFIELLGQGGQLLLWRGGRLKVGDDGALMTAAGIPLKASVSVPIDADNLAIDANGKVTARSYVDGEALELGQINLVRVSDGAALDRHSGGVYSLAEGSDVIEATPGEDGTGLLVQGGTERSNVDLNSEMVSLLLTQRSYSANAQVLRAADELLGVANGLRR